MNGVAAGTATLPAESGGATARLVDGPIDIGSLESAVAGSGYGAVVTFAGRARDTSDDGRTVVEELKASADTAGIPIVILSGVARGEEQDWKGAYFLGKPFSPDELGLAQKPGGDAALYACEHGGAEPRPRGAR